MQKNNVTNLDELYGYLLLARENLTVYNPRYVRRYGHFMRALRGLDKSKPNYDYLLDSYTNSANSAKFYATYPEDLTDKHDHELRSLRSKVL